MLYRVGNIFYMVEMLLAASIFLYAAPKKSGFVWRYLVVMVFHVVFAWFFPTIIDIVGYGVFSGIRSVVQLCVTIVGTGLIYDLSFGSRLPCCVAGYAVQHIAYNFVTLISYTDLLRGLMDTGIERHMLLELLFFPPIYLLVVVTFGRYAAKNQGYKNHDYRFVLLSFVTVFVCTGIRRVAAVAGGFDSVTACLYSITCCFLTLLVQVILFRMVTLQHENETVQLLWKEGRKHYEISRQNMELINLKCHDMKYILSALNGKCSEEELRSMERALQIYDSSIKTGNEALDLLLAENSLRCRREGIMINYSGNGADLSFMNITDVYSLFGNAVDNAIEAVRRLGEAGKRLINIALEKKGEVISINISNYHCGEAVFEDGIPMTTKPDAQMHGYGMKSMRLIAEKYGGSLKAAADGDIFNLSIYLIKTK